MWKIVLQIKTIEQTKKMYKSNSATENGIKTSDLDLQFINYGRTELVYVLTEKKTGKRTTLLAKQPVVEFGSVKAECDNLRALAQRDFMVVAPTHYYSKDGQELYDFHAHTCKY